MRPDERRKAQKNWRRIRWNTLRIFRAEHAADGCRSFAAVGWSMSDGLLPQNEAQQPIIRVSSLSLHSLFMLDHHTMFMMTDLCGEWNLKLFSRN